MPTGKRASSTCTSIPKIPDVIAEHNHMPPHNSILRTLRVCSQANKEVADFLLPNLDGAKLGAFVSFVFRFGVRAC